jgi:hypothetical protein
MLKITNEELLAAYHNRAALQVRHTTLGEELKRVREELGGVENQLRGARQVTDVLDGLCVSIRRDEVGQWTEGWTLAEPVKRHAKLYEDVRVEGKWLVQVNEYDGVSGRWPGGKALGLMEAWSYADAEDVARKWLKRDEALTESVLANVC